MEMDETFDDVEAFEVENNEEKAIDVEEMVKKARRSQKIAEADVQAILASADEEQADKLYEQLQQLGIRIVSESGETVDDLGDSSSLLEVDLTVEMDGVAIPVCTQ